MRTDVFSCEKKCQQLQMYKSTIKFWRKKTMKYTDKILQFQAISA